VRSIAAGANAFVPKPVESLALLQKIAGLLQLEYVYQGEAGEAQPAPSSAPAADVLRAAVQQGDGQRVVEAIRSAAELGQMPRVEALIAEVADAALQRALRDALATGLKEQDSELVLDGLTQALGDTPR
jgi:CheY-like chemotaxis protein